jgi:predicted RNase H-like HicB family nuclease
VSDTRRDFTVVVERDEDGNYVASVPALAGCHTQARSLDELIARVQEAIAVCLEDDDAAAHPTLEFIGVQRVTLPA